MMTTKIHRRNRQRKSQRKVRQRVKKFMKDRRLKGWKGEGYGGVPVSEVGFGTEGGSRYSKWKGGKR